MSEQVWVRDPITLPISGAPFTLAMAAAPLCARAQLTTGGHLRYDLTAGAAAALGCVFAWLAHQALCSYLMG